jgi:hypothetical protein
MKDQFDFKGMGTNENNLDNSNNIFKGRCCKFFQLSLNYV